MRFWLAFLVFFFFSVTPNTAQFRVAGGQRATEEYEVMHVTPSGIAQVQKEGKAKAARASLVRPRRQIARVTGRALSRSTLKGHRLWNGLMAPMLR